MIIAIIIKLILAAVFLGVVLNLAGILTWVERKQSAVMQDRIGANRAWIEFKPWWLQPVNWLLRPLNVLGLFHALADAVKMFVKEDFVPKGADKFLHTLAPMISVIFALLAFAAIPFGNTLHIGGRAVNLQIADMNAGLLFVFAMMSLGVYGVILGGFSSNNKYAYLGGMRAASQMLSYEITMGISIMGIVLCYGTLNPQEIVRHQSYLWGFAVQPLAFLLFMTTALAETKRVPFDLPEGESEIIGYFLEYSGMKFGMFFLTDLVETVLVACLMTTFFFGGWQVPFLSPDGFRFSRGFYPLSHGIVIALGVIAFLSKVVFFNWLFMAIRWTLPRFRYDQLMHLGWKILFPLSLVNVLITSIIVVMRSH
ncbi:MAG: NADH-quinone oxidoreductase subunit H [Candidatus Omnitrophica bacterium CG07_land_8_20_14_0_80_50_8]|nr:MAG: NADH-quinone oxidoreductase subunit H [Candidatus Omnitrophica bacterium CG07_land_8_20_14_0_80_50_8]